MSVSGQSAISYSYNNDDRLTQITQGSSTVGFNYDAAGRRTQITLPNGVASEYNYDNASRLTGITYKKGATVLGDLSYNYDAAGRRVAMGDSYARTELPVAVASASYNDANHQIAFAGQSLSYDNNGNLTGDGVNSYTWNARNQLVSISGPGLSASFTYDALGRRISKSINSAATAFLYDKANIVQEQAAGSATANLLTGFSMDEVFTRSVASGASGLLADGLGSAIALTDTTGAVQTEYSYEPFGKATASGAASSNSQTYTGREDDQTGLYYYRARYYSPALQRFISEDPAGFVDGYNLYAYVSNSPVNLTDPSGNMGFAAALPLAGAGPAGWILLAGALAVGVALWYAAEHSPPFPTVCEPVVPRVIPRVIPFIEPVQDQPKPKKGYVFIGAAPSGNNGKTCMYKCHNWGSIVTYGQRADLPCPGIRPDGLVDIGQLQQ